MSQFYLRANSYLNIQNQLKPFFFGGIKVTRSVGGDATYDKVGKVSSELTSNLFSFFNLGVGTLYQFNNGMVIKGEVGTRFFPDCKIGVGWSIK